MNFWTAQLTVHLNYSKINTNTNSFQLLKCIVNFLTESLVSSTSYECHLKVQKHDDQLNCRLHPDLFVFPYLELNVSEDMRHLNDTSSNISSVAYDEQ